VDTASVGGFDAVVVRYTEEPELLDRLRMGDRSIVVRQFVTHGYVFQVGTWTLAHPGKVTQQLDAVVASVRVFQPRPWTATIEGGVRLRLPGGWVERDSPLQGGVLHALAPGDPTHAWAYVFHYTDSPEASLQAALTKIPANGGTIVGQRDATLAGRAATRLDFLFPDGKHSHADDVEWFVSDGHGGTYVLAVGRRSGDPRIADRLAAAFKVVG
jgi:hypothetical protein